MIQISPKELQACLRESDLKPQKTGDVISTDERAFFAIGVELSGGARVLFYVMELETARRTGSR